MSPYEHPEYLSLLAAVRAVPEDDLARLVLADWLEENGEPERAVFIRCQIARANCPYFGASAYAYKEPLDKREKELYLAAGHRWLPEPLYDKGFVKGLFNAVSSRDWWERGFLHTVRAPLPLLYGDGGVTDTLKRVVREHPLVAVKVADRAPFPWAANLRFRLWYPERFQSDLPSGERTHEESDLPDGLFDAMTGTRFASYRQYDDLAPAEADVSDTLIRLAALPPE